MGLRGGVIIINAMARTSQIALALLLCSALFVLPAVRAEEGAEADGEDALSDVGIGGDIEKEAADELARMDSDKDGKVSLEEIKAYFRTEFYSDEDMADSTEGADGKPPTAEEIQELVKNDATEFLNELDKNKDGFLDLAELKDQYNTEGMDMDEDEFGEDDEEFPEEDEEHEDAPEVDEE